MSDSSLKKQLDEDLSRLKKMMGKVLEADIDAVRDHLQKKEESKILDLACGAAFESDILTEVVAQAKDQGLAKVRLTGFDLREREIDDARRRFGKASTDYRRGIEKNFEFLSGDATKLDDHSQLGDDFDLVFLRHQNYWNGIQTWDQIFDQALSKLDDDGRLIITSYFDLEHELAVEAIERLGGQLIKSEANPESRKLSTPGKSIDRHIAIFKRKDS